MCKALVTGGSGFIGGHLVQQLELAGYDVLVADIKAPNYVNHAEFFKYDVVNEFSLNPFEFDVVFHCAGLLGTETLFDKIKASAETNIIGTINILNWAKRNKDITVVQPNLLGEWLNMYMITKHCAERIGLMYNKEFGVKYVSIRPTDVYGPRQTLEAKKAASTFISQAIRNQPIPIYGDGSSWVNYVYVEDVARFMIKVFESGVTGRIIDFAYPNGDSTVLEFAKAIIRIANSESDIVYCPMRRGQPGDIKTIKYSLATARKIMKLDQLTTLEKGLQETVMWYYNREMQ